MKKFFFLLMSLTFCFASCSKDDDNDPVVDNSTELMHNGHAYVDLGLPSGTMWATCNVGANKPEDFGDYFACGETKPKTNYDHDSFMGATYYYDVDDAARANWGGQWRMPTREELEELWKYCTWTWTSMNGAEGYKVSSNKNSNAIFLPAAGFYMGTNLIQKEGGFYWSSTYDTYGGANHITFYSTGIKMSSNNRWEGKSVRAVL